jgi:aryl carrier-like protein
MLLDTIPLTPNGKVDRRALPPPDRSKPSLGSTYAEPRSPEERTMAEIWAEVLQLERVGINDNLFELGADSLHVFQITGRANKAGIPVTPRQILQYRTIAAIFAHLATEPQNDARGPTQAIKPVPRHKYRLASPVIQQAK